MWLLCLEPLFCYSAPSVKLPPPSSHELIPLIFAPLNNIIQYLICNEQWSASTELSRLCVDFNEACTDLVQSEVSNTWGIRPPYCVWWRKVLIIYQGGQHRSLLCGSKTRSKQVLLMKQFRMRCCFSFSSISLNPKQGKVPRDTQSSDGAIWIYSNQHLFQWEQNLPWCC